MAICRFCGVESPLIAEVLQICRNCVLNKKWEEIEPYLSNVHEQVRTLVELPAKPPKALENSINLGCNFCLNECRLGPTDVSYCGLRNIKKNKTGELPIPQKNIGYIHGYLDRNPTNCCNVWICPAGTKNGFPEYSDINGPEYGTFSYAAFLYGCTFNCLFCQNDSHKYFTKNNLKSAEDIANQITQNEKITCICYFGGTPEAQLPFTINLSKKILEKIADSGQDRKFRVCWEWNGSGNKKLIEECMKIAIKTGGNIKFDLKTFHEKLNFALCGVSNKTTLSNFKYLAEKYFGIRQNLPELSACTLLVPGYVNYEEIELISKFISSINNKIPYSLLVFHGAYQMRDSPITSKNEVIKSFNLAKNYLDNVNIGNKFLLSYY